MTSKFPWRPRNPRQDSPSSVSLSSRDHSESLSLSIRKNMYKPRRISNYGQNRETPPATFPNLLRTIASVVAYVSTGVLLVLYNKWLLSSDHFSFPITIVLFNALLMTLFFAGVVLLFYRNTLSHTAYWPTRVTLSYILKRLLPVAALLSADISLTNVAFEFTSVALTEIVKSAVPVIVFAYAVFQRTERVSVCKVSAIALLTAGISLTTYGEIGFSHFGFLAAVGATLSKAGKIIGFERLLKGSPKNVVKKPVHLTSSLTSQHTPQGAPRQHEDRDFENKGIPKILLLLYLNPLTSILLLVPFLLWEYDPLFESSFIHHSEWQHTVRLLAASAALVMLHAASELWVIEVTSALSFTVVSVVNLLFIVLFSVFLFSEQISLVNGAGFVCALLAVGLYNYVKALEREESGISTPNFDERSPSMSVELSESE